ncbi:outer membrane transport energization protein TonB [Leeuwenhoekiella aestuarii]|uniref:Outer membrane transport energization protein TonB n=1 Tax=Leeuwenhoekiella aestuarii TaxID=2249426 RepID=A0A4Q0NTN8_9FLAO|nr:energy transducer TonB [Leeuwenhoekiella aestuarii]RXG14110.1 outer membrane transport energization protein TonB [Leeuwenhoekiella aestuarii]RXG18859.1 outer membrane transport energization protein TonB [Leeuwenhoekiella aestuarii]
MNDSQKSEVNARQSVTRKTSKHDVNLQKNNVVFFQLGLIVALILAIAVIEVKSPVTPLKPPVQEDVASVSIDNIWNEPVRREEKKKPAEPKKEVSKVLPPKIADPDVPEIDLPVDDFTPETDIPDLESLVDIPEPDIETFSVLGVEVVPIFPGCEGLQTNAERKACLQDKMGIFISKNFNTSLGEEYGLTGMNKVDVQFTIDEHGKVTELKTRAPHPALEQEAERVMQKLPQMTPGKQQNRNVRVIYYQPIRFKVQN